MNSGQDWTPRMPRMTTVAAAVRRTLASLSGLDSPSGRAVRQGPDAVAELAGQRSDSFAFDMVSDTTTVTVFAIGHDFGSVPPPVMRQAGDAAARVLRLWSDEPDSPRWV